MAFTSTSYAAGTFASVKNVVLVPSAEVLPRRIGIIGTYDPLKTAVANEVPVLVTSPEDVAAQFGDGFMLHHLARAAFVGSGGLPTYVIPQAEVAGAQAAGTVTFTATTPEAGTVPMYIDGDAVPFTVLSTSDAEAVAAAAVAAITAKPELPVTATNTAGVMDVVAKTEGTYGNEISVAFNLGAGQALPSGIGAVVVALTSGTGVPDIDDALNALGTGDNSNEDFYTEIIHGYLQDSTTLDKISTYNGVGNDFVGNYAKEVGRPFRTLTGDVAVGSAALSALVAIGDARKEDRTNGVIAVPGSQTHPSTIAALALGVMAKTANLRPEETTIGKLLSGVWPGARGADRWTADYDSRNTAALAGVSPTLVKSGAVYMQDTLTFYHPDTVPLANNGYKSQRNIAITQNLLNSNLSAFSSERWQGVTIVADTGAVSSSVNRAKVVDRDSVIDQLIALVTLYAGNAWLYTAEYTIGRLNSDPTLVTTRGDGRGFIVVLPVIYSGEGAVLDVETNFDVSIAVTL